MHFGKLLVLAAAVIPAAMWASNVSASGLDFSPYISGGKIVVGGFDDGLGMLVEPEMRVGELEFGELQPYFVDEPGISVQDGSGFAEGSHLRFYARETFQSRYLSYWDGNGDVEFGAADPNVKLALSIGSRSVTMSNSVLQYSGAGSDSIVGMLIDAFDEEGGLHGHLESNIYYNDAQVDGTIPIGMYLISFNLLNPGGVEPSDPLFIIYSNGLSEAAHEAAVNWVTANALPEPSCLAPLALAGLLAMRRSPRGSVGGQK